MDSQERIILFSKSLFQNKYDALSEHIANYMHH